MLPCAWHGAQYIVVYSCAYHGSAPVAVHRPMWHPALPPLGMAGSWGPSALEEALRAWLRVYLEDKARWALPELGMLSNDSMLSACL